MYQHRLDLLGKVKFSQKVKAALDLSDNALLTAIRGMRSYLQ